MAKEKATISATLGHEYEDLEEREDFLANNADSVEKMEFIKRFNSDELMKKKDLFALQSARASDIEEEIKDFREQKKAELKPIKEEISSLLKEIKQKGSMVNEKVYKFVDREAKMTAFYMTRRVILFLPVRQHVTNSLAMYTHLIVTSRLCSLLSHSF